MKIAVDERIAKQIPKFGYLPPAVSIQKGDIIWLEDRMWRRGMYRTCIYNNFKSDHLLTAFLKEHYPEFFL